MALMFRWPLPSKKTLAVEALAVSTSPVPQLAAPPGYCVPVRRSQLAADGEVFAAPSKLSDQIVTQFPLGVVAVAVGVFVGPGEVAVRVGVVVAVAPPEPR